MAHAISASTTPHIYRKLILLFFAAIDGNILLFCHVFSCTLNAIEVEVLLRLSYVFYSLDVKTLIFPINALIV